MELVEQNNFTVCLTEFASLESKFSLKEKNPPLEIIGYALW